MKVGVTALLPVFHTPSYGKHDAVIETLKAVRWKFGGSLTREGENEWCEQGDTKCGMIGQHKFADE